MTKTDNKGVICFDVSWTGQGRERCPQCPFPSDDDGEDIYTLEDGSPIDYGRPQN